MKVRIFTILVSIIAATTGFAQCEHCAARVQMEGSDSNSDVTLAAYFEIQRALANDDFKASSTVAVALHEKTSKMTCPIEDEACCDTLKSSTLTMSEASDIKGIRDAFKNLSNALIARLETQGSSASPVYKMHCPMTSGGTWLQDNPDLRNPYYGAVMIKCGMQQAVIGKQ
ncbi:MAG: DUF3347 domain-containing protein [Opitutales bacterium]|jgi:Cu(I)/Ag(I) efflux system membrane fusion protein|nr:DUF3347 domain-containing protein [Opitutales bacterium]